MDNQEKRPQPKLVITPVEPSEYRRLIKKHLHESLHPPDPPRFIFGDHIVKKSSWLEYVQLAYQYIELEGPRAEQINIFLKNRKCTGLHYVSAIHCLIMEEVMTDIWDLPRQLHVINLKSGQIDRTFSCEGNVLGVRPNTAELLVRVWQKSVKEWLLVNIQDGTQRQVCTFGWNAYLSADGRFFFPVEDWASIGLVDLTDGILLDRKNKRHFSKYATKVKIIHEISFDPDAPSLVVLLARKLEYKVGRKLEYTPDSMKNAVCLRLTVSE